MADVVRAMVFHKDPPSSPQPILAAGIRFDPDRVYPVHLMYDWSQPVGAATVERDEDGNLWATVSFHERPPLPVRYAGISVVGERFQDEAMTDCELQSIGVHQDPNIDPRVPPWQ